MYYLNGQMGLEGMLINMMGEADTTETVRIMFPEGYTVPEIVDLLVENEVCDRASLLSVIESTDFSYSLVSDLQSKETVPYRLEGYLFPDTYDFYIGQSASSVIETFLNHFEEVITEEHRAKAEELGYTMDEVITIASIVQAEAGSEDQMSTIAAVIENRLADTTNFLSLDVSQQATILIIRLRRPFPQRLRIQLITIYSITTQILIQLLWDCLKARYVILVLPLLKRYSILQTLTIISSSMIWTETFILQKHTQSLERLFRNMLRI